MPSRPKIVMVCLTVAIAAAASPALYGQQVGLVLQDRQENRKTAMQREARFLRLQYDDQGVPVAMETAVTSFVPRKKQGVGVASGPCRCGPHRRQKLL